MLPHNDITSPSDIEKLLDSGATSHRARQPAMKRLKRRISMKKDGDLVSKISMDVLLDNTSDSVQHKQQVHQLLQLAGLDEDMGVGDPSKDQELMTVICDVLSNYDPTTQVPRKTKKAGNKALLQGSKPVGV